MRALASRASCFRICWAIYGNRRGTAALTRISSSLRHWLWRLGVISFTSERSIRSAASIPCGIANQMLATIALCVATGAMIRQRKALYAWVTLAPLSWLFAVTMTAGFEKIMRGAANVGFLHAALLEAELASPAVSAARAVEIPRLVWNDQVDAVMTAAFIFVVWIVLADSVRVWARLLLGAAGPHRSRGRSRRVKYQLSDRVAHSTALIRWPLAFVRKITIIADELCAELKRLNRGGEYHGARKLRSRRMRPQVFKAALAQRYREHNHLASNPIEPHDPPAGEPCAVH
jgi:hypothetical protein